MRPGWDTDTMVRHSHTTVYVERHTIGEENSGRCRQRTAHWAHSERASWYGGGQTPLGMGDRRYLTSGDESPGSRSWNRVTPLHSTVTRVTKPTCSAHYSLVIRLSMSLSAVLCFPLKSVVSTDKSKRVKSLFHYKTITSRYFKMLLLASSILSFVPMTLALRAGWCSIIGSIPYLCGICHLRVLIQGQSMIRTVLVAKIMPGGSRRLVNLRYRWNECSSKVLFMYAFKAQKEFTYASQLATSHRWVISNPSHLSSLDVRTEAKCSLHSTWQAASIYSSPSVRTMTHFEVRITILVTSSFRKY